MRFIINLTRREIRSSWRRLLFFFLCVALGVGSIVFLRSLIGNITRVVGDDARALMTADIELSTTSDFTPAETAAIEKTASESGIVEARGETITAATMARPSDPAIVTLKFVELKGIEPPFPLVGSFQLSSGQPFDFRSLDNNGAVVAKGLLEDLQVKVGDLIRIGTADFQIRATFDEEPGGTSGFRLGPRAFIAKSAFDTAGITQNSRVRRRILYRTSGDPTKLVAKLREALKGTTVQVASYREQQENLSDQFERIQNYLSLTGLLILVLGGVGVWNVARAFIEQKRKTVAILKCLGAGGGRIVTIYLLQIITLGIGGSLFGVLFAQAGLGLTGLYLYSDLPAKLSYVVGASASFQGIFLGVAVSILFSLLPLLQIRDIKPRLLLRDENTALQRLGWTRWSIGAGCLAALFALAIWQAGSIKVGALFLGGMAAAICFLSGAAFLITWLTRHLGKRGPFALRQAVNSLYRPGNQTRVVLLAVGLGVFVVITVQLMRSNLIQEFDFTRNGRLPSLVLVDVQPDQVKDISGMITERTGEVSENVPTVRGRIAFINGKPIDYDQKEVRQNQGQIGREFALTYRAGLGDNETIVSGRWWDRSDGVPEVSVEEQLAQTIGVEPGDSITFDVSGRFVTARVADLRHVDVRSGRTAFGFVFEPGLLDPAPQSYALTLVRHVPSVERLKLQRDILDRFPNVQIFDVDDILDAVKKLIGNFVIAISFVGTFVLLSGILILIGSVALTKSQRIYENAILKTLGSTRRMLIGILVTEYSVLGLLAGLVASGFAVLLSYLIARFLMKIEWHFDPVIVFGGVAATWFVVTVVGTAASFGVLFRKPLTVLRSQ